MLQLHLAHYYSLFAWLKFLARFSCVFCCNKQPLALTHSLAEFADLFARSHSQGCFQCVFVKAVCVFSADSTHFNNLGNNIFKHVME